MKLKLHVLVWGLFFLSPCMVRAQSSLFYLEAQGVAGYSSTDKGAVFYSMSQDEAMQKPSVGFDYLRRLSGERGDYGALALQIRLAYDHEPESELEFQVYNAFFKYKAGFADLWIGHDRSAFGLASYLDSHGLLLQPLGMHGYGFDRDWGGGVRRDLSWGSFAASLTTGSGMPLEFNGNWLASARVSKGILAQENYSIGFSAAWGDILETMGYEIMMPDPIAFHMALADWTYFLTRYESRLELAAGERAGDSSYAALWRFGVNLLEENRLKVEFQPIFRKQASESNWLFSAGLSCQLTAGLALRSMYEYDESAEENRIVAQVYYYKRI
ncbi:MAG: hypothetical protein HY770_04510 [Chitinivibrionia bacterium]|nr:hypothetical protein [Chitinivibrionia bacterium]